MFPSSPTNNQIYNTSESHTYIYNSATNTWEFLRSNNAIGFLKTNNATSDPTVVDDITKEYQIGSTWVNTTNKQSFICVSNIAGSALWVKYNSHLGTSYPLNPSTGQMFLNTNTNIAYVYNGNSWIDISASGSAILSRYNMNVDPVPGNDSNQGYSIGSIWVNISTDNAFLCVSNTSNNAVWLNLTDEGFQSLATDPATPFIGQFWYNTTTNTFKCFDGIVKTFTLV